MRCRKISVLIAICVFTGAIGVTAFLLDSMLKINEFTEGNNVSIVRESWNPPAAFEAGKSYEKVVKVKNTGTVDCFVRAVSEVESPEMREAVSINYNKEFWEKADDSYYYYKEILKPGQETKPLFTEVHTEKTLDDFNLYVYEETVQSEGFRNAAEAFRKIKGDINDGT